MPMQFVLGGSDMGTAVVRLGKVAGFIGQANLGLVGSCGVPFDDPAGNLTVTGWQTFVVNELDGPIGQQRLFTGYIADRKYSRGTSGTNDSLRTGAERLIGTTLADINSILNWRLFPPTDAAAKRPIETDIARLEWLLSTSYLTPTVTNYGFVNTSGAISMDAASYQGQSAFSLLQDCAQISGKNFFLYYDETNGGVGIFYDFDYSTAFTSTLKLSNVLADIDNSTTFAIDPDATMEVDPTNVYAGVQVPFSGANSPQYVTDAGTAATFGVWRDTTAPNINAKTASMAQANGFRYLLSVATEDQKVTLTVKLPSNKVTLVREGMRIQLKASHLPGLTSFTYCRILSREAKQDEATSSYYNCVLELSPPIQPASAFCSNGPTAGGTYAPNGSGTAAGTGNLIYWKPGLSAPTVPTPGFSGGWNFPAYSTGGGDEAGDCTSNYERIIVAGNGTLTIPTYQAGFARTWTAQLIHLDPVTNNQIVDQTQTGTYGATIVFSVTGWSQAGGPCYHWVDITDSGGTCGAKVGYNGFIWAPV